jgi:hypothetical protein
LWAPHVEQSPAHGWRWDAHAAVAPLVAATYVVDTSADAGSLIDCSDKAKRCTLRDAIQKANANDGDDTIVFAIPDSDPRCGRGHCTILLSSALPDLTTNINIQGPGAEDLTVFRNSASDFRIFNVTTTGTAAFQE